MNDDISVPVDSASKMLKEILVALKCDNHFAGKLFMQAIADYQ